MKKKLLTVFLFILSVTFVLSGCATVGDVKDKEGNLITFDTPVYCQGQVMQIGDYLYYPNAVYDASGSDFDYNASAKNGYMARINTTKFTFEEDVKVDNRIHTSPKGIEKVNGALVGQKNQHMIAYGDYLYYTAVSTHKTSDMENLYSMISIFRMKFNGDSVKEIDSVNFDENSTFTMQKGSDGKYYLVVIAPTASEESDHSGTYDVYSYSTDNGSKKVIAEHATSAVACDENSTRREVFASFKAEDVSGQVIKSYDFATGEETTHDNGVDETELKLLAMTGDQVFYSYTKKSVTGIHVKDVKTATTFDTEALPFYTASTIKNVTKINDKIAFTTEGGALMLVDESGKPQLLVAGEKFSDFLFVDGDYIYLSNDSSIMRISVLDKQLLTVASFGEKKISSGVCGYANGYLYLFAERGDLVLDEGEEQKEDTNKYMYQLDKEGNIQLISSVK